MARRHRRRDRERRRQPQRQQAMSNNGPVDASSVMNKADDPAKDEGDFPSRSAEMRRPTASSDALPAAAEEEDETGNGTGGGDDIGNGSSGGSGGRIDRVNDNDDAADDFDGHDDGGDNGDDDDDVDDDKINIDNNGNNNNANRGQNDADREDDALQGYEVVVPPSRRLPAAVVVPSRSDRAPSPSPPATADAAADAKSSSAVDSSAPVVAARESAPPPRESAPRRPRSKHVYVLREVVTDESRSADEEEGRTPKEEGARPRDARPDATSSRRNVRVPSPPRISSCRAVCTDRELLSAPAGNSERRPSSSAGRGERGATVLMCPVKWREGGRKGSRCKGDDARGGTDEGRRVHITHVHTQKSNAHHVRLDRCSEFDDGDEEGDCANDEWDDGDDRFEEAQCFRAARVESLPGGGDGEHAKVKNDEVEDGDDEEGELRSTLAMAVPANAVRRRMEHAMQEEGGRIACPFACDDAAYGRADQSRPGGKSKRKGKGGWRRPFRCLAGAFCPSAGLKGSDDNAGSRGGRDRGPSKGPSKGSSSSSSSKRRSPRLIVTDGVVDWERSDVDDLAAWADSMRILLKASRGKDVEPNADGRQRPGLGPIVYGDESVTRNRMRPVDEIVCVSRTHGVYVAECRLSASDCRSIVDVAESCASSRGGWSSYTYAKQTLGCREDDRLAFACARPVMTACATIRAHLTEGGEGREGDDDQNGGDDDRARGDGNDRGDGEEDDAGRRPRPSASSPSKELVLDVREPHVVKYDTVRAERGRLDMHTDKSEWTFLIALSEGRGDEYGGGGTYFQALDATVHLQRGQMLIFRGKLRHSGVRIRGGRRYLLVGFLVPSARGEGGRRVRDGASAVKRGG